MLRRGFVLWYVAMCKWVCLLAFCFRGWFRLVVFGFVIVYFGLFDLGLIFRCFR